MAENGMTPTEATPVTDRSDKHGVLTGATAIVLYIAAASFLAHMLTAGRYGYFRDELYYLACARHLALGYVDQPPMIAIVTWLTSPSSGAGLRWPYLAHSTDCA